MNTKNMDVRMSDTTIKQQQEIKVANNISIAKTREIILAEGVAKLHKKLFKPQSVLDNLAGAKNE